MGYALSKLSHECGMHGVMSPRGRPPGRVLSYRRKLVVEFFFSRLAVSISAASSSP